MTTSWLIDTNVLIYSYDQTQKLHPPSYSLLEYAMAAKIQACISHQNLLEFLAVVINSKRVEHPLSTDEALQKIAFYVTCFSLVHPLPKTFFTFADLISKYPILRDRIFDLYLSATALDNGITQICTWNVKHFKTIAELTAKTPEEILSLAKK